MKKYFLNGAAYRQSFRRVAGIIYLVSEMIVYADVLIFVNMIVDYFLLRAVGGLLSLNSATWRMVLSAFVGGLSSIYIFFPQQSTAVELLYNITSAALMSVLCYGKQTVKGYLRSVGVLLLVTCAYAGIMFAIWSVFRPRGMVMNNSVVYFDISPTILVVCSVGGYFLFSILWKIFSRGAKFAQKCSVMVCVDEKSIELVAIADTGNSLEDVFGRGEIIITGKKQVEELFGGIDFEVNPQLKSRYRIIPCNTVSGYDTLESFRCDSATVENKGHKIKLKKPLLAVAKSEFADDYDAIINPKILR